MAALTLTVLFALFSVAFTNDLRSGFTDPRQRLIFEQKYDYSPSIYTRSETINVDTHGSEIISQIEVVDERELKDGQARVIAGGVGQKFVTIELSGPAVFRGMTFLVRVYAVNNQEFYRSGRVGDYNTGYNQYGVKSGGYVYDTQAPISTGFDNRYVKQ